MAEVDPELKEPRFKVGDDVIGTWNSFAQGGLAGALPAAVGHRMIPQRKDVKCSAGAQTSCTEPKFCPKTLSALSKTCMQPELPPWTLLYCYGSAQVSFSRA